MNEPGAFHCVEPHEDLDGLVFAPQFEFFQLSWQRAFFEQVLEQALADQMRDVLNPRLQR